ncbi:MAG: ABC transporter permease [Candidatus Krumholzibacteriota bacterium]|nr:ABC transporter permease [Candidatus Krumholzibacteriota bacterium]
MKKMFKVVKREYLERVKKKSFLIGTILGPLLMGGIIFAPALFMKFTPESVVKIAVIDGSGVIFDKIESALSDTLPDGTNKYELRKIETSGLELNTIKRDLNLEIESDVIDGYLVLPEDVVKESKATFFGKKLGNIKTMERFESAIDNVVISERLKREGLEYDVVGKLVKEVEIEMIQIKEGEEEAGKGFDSIFMSTMVFIMLLYMSILMWGIVVQRSVIEEKNNRVIEVMLSSLRPIDLLLGKIIGVGAVGLTQYLIWVTCALVFALYGLSLGGPVAEIAANLSPATMAYFVVYYLLGFFFYATMFAGVGAVCNTDQEAQQLQQPIVLCLVFTIIVPMMIIQNPDGMFATLLSLIPMFTPIVMFMRINILTPPAWQILLSILIMLGAIYISALISAKIFRIGILMYGKRPDMREIFKWMKRA